MSTFGQLCTCENMYSPSHISYTVYPHLSTKLPGISVNRVNCRQDLVTVSHVGVQLSAALPQPTGVGWF